MEIRITDALLLSSVSGTLKERVEELCEEIRAFRKVRSLKRYLVLEKYSQNEMLCGHITNLLAAQPQPPTLADKDYKPVMILLLLCKSKEVEYYLTELLDGYCKRHETNELLYLCDALSITGNRQPLYGMLCYYFYLERRNQLRKRHTPVRMQDFQHAERRLEALGTAVFKLQVELYGYKAKTVEELAGMYGMSVRTFRERFANIYKKYREENADDESHNDREHRAKRWLLQQRAERIRHDLKYDYDLPLQEIAHRNGFSSPSNFADFCKTYLNGYPSELQAMYDEELCGERNKYWHEDG